jgi:hypothetical protein
VIAGGAAVATGIFGLLDAYHGWLYSEALRRAKETERILGLRYKQLERRAVDPDSTADLETALATHRFGQYSNLPGFRLLRLKKARPTVVYAGIYGALAALSGAVIAYYTIA